MEKFAIGQAVPRTEDPRLLRGRGRYVDDIVLPRMVRAYVLRSPHAHAEIRSIDTAAAKDVPGVLGIYTGADYAASGNGSHVSDVSSRVPGKVDAYNTTQLALAIERVRFVGEGVVLIVAETLEAAKDASELIAVDYDPLPANVNTARAVEPGAIQVWGDCPGNVSYVYESGDKARVDAAFAAAHHVTRRRFVINRITANAMEPRGCIAEYDEGSGRYTIHVGVQSPHGMRQMLANEILHVPESKVRVIADDMGGSFGMKGASYAEYFLALWTARLIGRPVKWVADRTESFLTDNQARDNISDAELALDAQGKFLALRVHTIANLGAYLGNNGATPTVANLGSLAGVYTTPAIFVQVKAIFTHTHYTAPYRGAGRPEASCVVERLVEQAAAEMAIDPVDLRRRNTIPASAMPYKTGLIFTYDCGDFEKNMDMALTAADHAGFAARRKESEARGKLRGIGIANTVEQAAGRGPESAEIRFDPSGTVTLMTGTSNHGQGHDVTFKQILSEKLGLDPDVITFAEGDTDRAALGTGTFGSRSAALGGSAVLMASDKIIARGKRIAANLLEASEADIVFDDGAFTIAGTDRSLTITEIAQAAFSPGKLPPGLEPGFNEMAVYTPSVPNFPAGCHVCECEIDPETGTIELLRYVVVDDVGTVINPLLLKGQIMGGVAQGIGQAVMEDIVYDAETGQLLTASFMDYCMPRAADFCSFEVSSNPIPTKTNPIGAKGAGEAGCVGALPCALIAINNALNQAGVGYFEMPATPHRVWRAIEDAKATKTSRKPLPKGVPAPPGGRRRLG